MKRSVLWGTALLLVATALQAATAFPFPRNATYPYGIKAATASSNGSEVQAAYENWLINQYEESGNLARVKFDDPTYTVSEGIGYGMLIFVYMDNATNNTKSKFDKLWAYYKANRNSNGVMNWKIAGFTNTCSGNNCNGATDAELDVALALMMAYKQWGDASYLADAKTLISAINNTEVSFPSNILKPGDKWETAYNPSYVSTAALEVFKKADGNDWSSVISANYTMLKANANGTSGLPSDWCDGNGNPVNGNSSIKFGYDAVRTPWRMALAYSWFGHADAKALDSKIAAWENSASSGINGDPAKIGDGYAVDGTKTSSYEVATYVGALVAAGMVDSKYQSWVNDGYTELSSFAVDNSYYHRSLKVLYMLTLSGNMSNFWGSSNGGGGTTTPSKFSVTTSATNGTIALSPAGGSYDSNLTVTATATPAAGYSFSNWSGACTGTGVCSMVMNANKTLTANFVKAAVPKYTVTTVAVNGTIALSPSGGSYDSNSTVTATATPAAGYRFGNWSNACIGTGACSIVMNTNKTLTANFVKVTVPTYALTTSATNGAIVLSPTGGTYDSNSTVTASATPNTGYAFSGWSGACTGTGACSVVMNSAKTLTATFALLPPTTYVLTVNAGTGGKVVKSPDSASYSSGKVVTLKARPDSAYKFSGWQGDCSGSDTTCTVTMTSAKSVTASFVAIPYHSLTLTAGNGKLTASPAGPKYAEGATVTVTAVPDAGYVFSAWYSGCNATNGSTCTVVIPNYDVTVNAGFSPAPVGIAGRLQAGERLQIARGMISFDASGIGDARLELTDLQGRTTLLWQGQGNRQQELSLRNVHPGLYFVHLSGQNGNFKKLVQILH